MALIHHPLHSTFDRCRLLFLVARKASFETRKWWRNIQLLVTDRRRFSDTRRLDFKKTKKQKCLCRRNGVMKLCWQRESFDTPPPLLAPSDPPPSPIFLPPLSTHKIIWKLLLQVSPFLTTRTPVSGFLVIRQSTVFVKHQSISPVVYTLQIHIVRFESFTQYSYYNDNKKHTHTCP